MSASPSTPFSPSAAAVLPDAHDDFFASSESSDLSAALDGESDEQALSELLTHWREDEGMRSTWHAYQLIGDVMRSEDLGANADHDEAFLQALRGRLANEAPIVAPLPPTAALPRPKSGGQAAAVMWARRHFSTPVALAAGVAVVAGAMVVVQRASVTPTAGQLAQGTASQGAVNLASAATRAGLQASAPNLQMIRDARIDWYLQAHRQYAPGSTLGGPGGAVRSVEWVPPKP